MIRKATCNAELLKDVSRVTREDTKLVKDITNHFSSYTSELVKAGAYETMLIPYFGKFKPKTKRIQKIHTRRGQINLRTWNSSELPKTTK